MKNDYKMSLEIIENVNKFLEEEKYMELRDYLDEKKKQVELCQKKSKNETAEYIDKLVKKLH